LRESSHSLEEGSRAKILENDMNALSKLGWVFGFTLIAGRAWGLDPLVGPEWAKENLETPQVVFVDIQDPEAYQRFHLPGAVNAPYAQWRTTGKGEPASMLPPVERLESLIGGLGIGNEDAVVIVASGRGAGDLSAAARVYWTFKVLGHDRVAVLNGGLVGYAKAGKGAFPLKSGPEKRVSKSYRAQVRPGLVASLADTRGDLERGVQMVDARSPGEFLGLQSGGDGERAGTIPGAKNLPFDWLTVNGSAELRSPGALKELYATLGVSATGEQVHFCHSGNRAALNWFVSYALFGNDQAKLYDGSMMEWSRQPDLPLEQKIELCQGC